MPRRMVETTISAVVFPYKVYHSGIVHHVNGWGISWQFQ
jgi:hypothetical protein